MEIYGVPVPGLVGTARTMPYKCLMYTSFLTCEIEEMANRVQAYLVEEDNTPHVIPNVEKTDVVPTPEFMTTCQMRVNPFARRKVRQTLRSAQDILGTNVSALASLSLYTRCRFPMEYAFENATDPSMTELRGIQMYLTFLAYVEQCKEEGLNALFGVPSACDKISNDTRLNDARYICQMCKEDPGFLWRVCLGAGKYAAEDRSHEMHGKILAAIALHCCL